MPKEPTPRTKQIVWVMAGGLCVRCKSNVLDATVSLMPLGEVAHAAGRSDDASAPRSVPEMSEDARNAPENLLLLCKPCHGIVDDELGQGVYGIEALLDMKREHESNVRHRLSLMEASSTLVVRVIGALNGQVTSVARLDVAAVAAQRHRVPVYLPRLHHADLEIDLTAVKETDPTYWDWCRRTIEDNAEELKHALDSGLTDHVTLFGFARMPLLVLLGWHLDDNFEVDVMHLSHEEPRWLPVPDASSYEFEVVVKRADQGVAHAEALLVLRLSGDPDPLAFPDETGGMLQVIVQSADGQARRDIADAEASRLLYREWGYVAMSRGRLTNQLYHGPVGDDDNDALHHHVHLDAPVPDLTSRLRRSRSELPISRDLVDIAVTWRELTAQLDAIDTPRHQELLDARDRLKEEAEALSHAVERLQQRLEQRGRGLARVRKRGALTELGAERDRAIARRDDLRDRLAAVDAATDGLPDRGELGDLLDRHEDLDAQLRRAATGRMFGYQAAPPPYLTRALGPPPADGPAHDLWERTATAIEHHRLRWQVTDPTGALGDPAGNRRMQRACAQLRDEIRRTVEYLERGRALHRSRGRAR